MLYRVICALGDSITNGYWDEDGLGWFGRFAMKVAKAYPYQYGFNNLAQDGDKIANVASRFTSEVLSRDVDILFVAVGVNDLVRYESQETPFVVSNEDRCKIWEALLLEAKKAMQHVIVISILPVVESKMPSEGVGGRLFWNLNKDIEANNNDLQNLCMKIGVEFFDVNPYWQKLNLPDYFYDSTHPNAKGHQLMADQVFEELQKRKIIS